MTKEECKKVVLDIIADIAPDEDLSNVKPDVRLRDQLQLDSMDFPRHRDGAAQAPRHRGARGRLHPARLA
jgi:uncharacterized protein (DUF934 family)